MNNVHLANENYLWKQDINRVQLTKDSSNNDKGTIALFRNNNSQVNQALTVEGTKTAGENTKVTISMPGYSYTYMDSNGNAQTATADAASISLDTGSRVSADVVSSDSTSTYYNELTNKNQKALTINDVDYTLAVSHDEKGNLKSSDATVNNAANSIALGVNASAGTSDTQQGSYAVAIGDNAGAGANNTVAIGHTAFAGGESAISIGTNATSSVNSTAIGKDSIANKNSVSIGGYDSTATIDHKTVTEGEYSVAIGTNAYSTANVGGTSVGGQSHVTATNGTAIGYRAEATGDSDSIALGSYSATDNGRFTINQDGTKTLNSSFYGYDVLEQNKDSTTWRANTGSVSVGGWNSVDQTIRTRQITYVAAGSADTDAVNVAQLKQLKTYVDQNSGNGSWNLETKKGSGESATTTKTTIGNKGTVSMTGANGIEVSQTATADNNGSDLTIKLDDETKTNIDRAVKYDTTTNDKGETVINYNSVTMGGTTYNNKQGGTKITNVAYAGDDEGSAVVNVDKLKDYTKTYVTGNDYYLRNGSESLGEGVSYGDATTGYKADDKGNIDMTVKSNDGTAKHVVLTDIASKAQQVTNTTNITTLQGQVISSGAINNDGTISLQPKEGDAITLSGKLHDSKVVQEGTSYDATTGTITVTSQDQYDSTQKSSVRIEGVASKSKLDELDKNAVKYDITTNDKGETVINYDSVTIGNGNGTSYTYNKENPTTSGGTSITNVAYAEADKTSQNYEGSAAVNVDLLNDKISGVNDKITNATFGLTDDDGKAVTNKVNNTVSVKGNNGVTSTVKGEEGSKYLEIGLDSDTKDTIDRAVKYDTKVVDGKTVVDHDKITLASDTAYTATKNEQGEVTGYTGGTKITNVAYAGDDEGSAAVNVDLLKDYTKTYTTANDYYLRNGSESLGEGVSYGDATTGYKADDKGNIDMTVKSNDGTAKHVVLTDIASKAQQVTNTTNITTLQGQVISSGAINNDGTISLQPKEGDAITLSGKLHDSKVVQEGTSYDATTGMITVTSQDQYDSTQKSSVKIEGVASKSKLDDVDAGSVKYVKNEGDNTYDYTKVVLGDTKNTENNYNSEKHTGGTSISNVSYAETNSSNTNYDGSAAVNVDLLKDYTKTYTTANDYYLRNGETTLAKEVSGETKGYKADANGNIDLTVKNNNGDTKHVILTDVASKSKVDELDKNAVKYDVTKNADGTTTINYDSVTIGNGKGTAYSYNKDSDGKVTTSGGTSITNVAYATGTQGSEAVNVDYLNDKIAEVNGGVSGKTFGLSDASGKEATAKLGNTVKVKGANGVTAEVKTENNSSYLEVALDSTTKDTIDRAVKYDTTTNDKGETVINYNSVTMGGTTYNNKQGGTKITNVAYAGDDEGGAAVNVDKLKDYTKTYVTGNDYYLRNGSESLGEGVSYGDATTGYKADDKGNIDMTVKSNDGTAKHVVLTDIASKAQQDINTTNITNNTTNITNNIKNITTLQGQVIKSGTIGTNGKITLNTAGENTDNITLDGTLHDSKVIQEGTSYDAATGTITVTSQDQYDGTQKSSVKIEGVASKSKLDDVDAGSVKYVKNEGDNTYDYTKVVLGDTTNTENNYNSEKHTGGTSITNVSYAETKEGDTYNGSAAVNVDLLKDYTKTYTAANDYYLRNGSESLGTNANGEAITVSGEKTGYKADANGNIDLTVKNNNGDTKHVILTDVASKSKVDELDKNAVKYDVTKNADGTTTINYDSVTIGNGKGTAYSYNKEKPTTSGGTSITNVAYAEADKTSQNYKGSAAVNVDLLNDKISDVNTLAGKHTKVTVEGGTEAKEGEYAGSSLKLKKTTVDGQEIYDLKLGNQITVGEKGEPGKDGEDGSIKIINQDGTNTTITITKDGKPGVNGKDGETTTRIVYDNKEVATLDDGLKFVGDDGQTISKKLNETLGIKGGVTESNKLSTNANVGVVKDANGDLKIELAKDITGINSIIVEGDITNESNENTVVNKKYVDGNDYYLREGGKLSESVTTGGKTYTNGYKVGEDGNVVLSVENNNGTKKEVLLTDVASKSAVDKLSDRSVKYDLDGENVNYDSITLESKTAYTAMKNDKGEVTGYTGGTSITNVTYAEADKTSQNYEGSAAVNVDLLNDQISKVSGDLTNATFGLTDDNDTAVTNKVNNTVSVKGADGVTSTVKEKTVGEGENQTTEKYLEIGLGNELTVGKDGQDGKIGVNGTNGKNGVGIDGNDGISIKGKDGTNGVTIKGLDGKDGVDGAEGHIGLNGKNGMTDIWTKNGVNGLNGEDGKDGMTRIVYKTEDGNEHEVATMDDGLKFVGDDGQTISKKLNETLSIKGGESDSSKLSTNANVGVVKDAKGDLKIELAKNINLGADGSVTTGNTVVNNDGVKIGDNTSLTENALKIAGNTYISNTGINANSQKIVNVAKGEVSSTSTDAVNGSQLYEVQTLAGKHTKVTVEGGTEAKEGEYAGSSLKLKKTTVDGQETYDLKLGDNLSIGGKDGTNGTDGHIGVNGKDGVSGVGIDGKDGISIKGADGKDGVTIKGKDGVDGVDGLEGHIGLNGKDGMTDIWTSLGQKGLNGEDGENGMTRIIYKSENGTKHEVATMDDGMKFGGDFGTVSKVTLNNQVNVKGNAKTEADLTDGNIGVVSSQDGENGQLLIKLNKDVNLGETGSVTTGDTVINNDGVKIGDNTSLTENALKIAGNTYISNTGINANSQKIVNVAKGEVSATSTDAVNGSQLYEVKNLASAHTAVTVNGGTAAPTDGTYSDGNLQLKQTTGENGQITYDLQLNKDLKAGKDGKDGAAGSIGIAGKDGKDGYSYTTITTKYISGTDGIPGIDGKDGKDGITRIVYKDGENNEHEVATLDDGLNFAGDTGRVGKKLNETLTIKGGISDEEKLTDGNIGVVVDEDGVVNVKLAKDINVDSITAANGNFHVYGDGTTTAKVDGTLFVVDKNGVGASKGNSSFVVTEDGASMASGSSSIVAVDGAIAMKAGDTSFTLNENGADFGGSQIHGVAAGTAGTDAVNVDQLNKAVEAGNTDTHIKAGEYAVTADNKVEMTVVDKNGNETGDKVTITDVAKASDMGKISDLKENVKNSDGSTTTVVDAINNLSDKVGDTQYKHSDGSGTTYVKAGEDVTTSIGKLDEAIGRAAETAKKHTTVTNEDGNITISETTNTDGGKNYEVGLNKKKIDLGNVTIEGEDGKITAKDLAADTATIGGVTIKDSTVSGLSNTTWDSSKVDKDASEGGYKGSTKAATESQLQQAMDGAVQYDRNEDGTVNKTKVTLAGEGGTTITNVKAGELSETSTDAVNGSQLYQTNQNVTNNSIAINNVAGKVNKLGNRINRVGAGAAALAALHPLDFDPDAKWDFAAGYGNYRGANAAAVGAYYRPNEDLMFSVGASVGGGENMVNAGVSVKLGAGSSHVNTSKVAMAKEIKELRGTVAEQSAQIAKLTELVNALVGVERALPYDKGSMFPDVPENHWAYEAVDDMIARGLVEGYPDGTYGGDRNLTRYEFAMIVHRALLRGAEVSERLQQEFAGELKYFTVDTVKEDRDGNPEIQRVRTVKENIHK